MEEIVVKLNLESEVTSDLQNTSSVEEKTTSNQINNKLLYPAWYPDSFIAPESRQTIFKQNNRGFGGVKPKGESSNYGLNERKSDVRSGPRTYKRSRISLFYQLIFENPSNKA